MKKSTLALIAILGLASITILFIEEAPSEPDLGLPPISNDIVQQAVDEASADQDEIRTPSTIGEVIFPHLWHIEDFEIECQECHHEIRATALHMPHEEYFEDFWIECGVCHKSDGPPEGGAMACSDCHHERPNGIADQTLSSKVVIHQNCWDCHDIGTGAEASAECSFCHSGEKAPFTPVNPDE
jgi:hypothetical protein